MTNRRADLQKLFKCGVCGKVDYKHIVPGAITFFDRCTFTAACSGRLSLDTTADKTSKTDLTWQQTPTIVKIDFVSQRVTTVEHNFGHLGSIVVEVFFDVVSQSGPAKLKSTEFIILNQTANTVVIDTLSQRTGTIVVTNNQYKINSVGQTAYNPVWTPPPLLRESTLSIAADIDTNQFVMSVGYRTISASEFNQLSLTLYSHRVAGVVSPSNIWSRYKVIAMEKPYFLYSVDLPPHMLARGTVVQLQYNESITNPTVILPFASADKSTPNDVVSNKIVRNSVVRTGDLMMDNNNLVVVNSAIIEELRKPFVIY